MAQSDESEKKGKKCEWKKKNSSQCKIMCEGLQVGNGLKSKKNKIQHDQKI